MLSLRGTDVYDDDVYPVTLRRKVGMVCQEPNPFPESIRDNVAQGSASRVRRRRRGPCRAGAEGRRAVGEGPRPAGASGLEMSGGQQPRLCIARAIAADPDVVLMDEPASALDPIATSKIEELIDDLAAEYTVVIVTHNMQQAARISDWTVVFLTGGELFEVAATETIFENPGNRSRRELHNRHVRLRRSGGTRPC